MALVATVEDAFRPRWVLWGRDIEAVLVEGGLRVSKCWDVAAVQRLLVGGWRMDPARAWALLHDLSVEHLPSVAALDLFTEPDDDGRPDEPLRADGYIKPEWLAADFEWTTERMARWAELAAAAAALQDAALARSTDRPNAASTARSESAAELLCAELSFDGLPMDRSDRRDDRRLLRRAASQERDRGSRATHALAMPRCLRHSTIAGCDLRNPAQVKSLLRSIGVELPDTRAWRLEAIRGHAPVDRCVAGVAQGRADGDDVRLRLARRAPGSRRPAARRVVGMRRCRGPNDSVGGSAQHAGAAALGDRCRARSRVRPRRPRADRAARSSPRSRVTARLPRRPPEDDMYLPVAEQLGVDRATAKVAVLGAMYGQTTGHGAAALRGLELAYPVAMRYLTDADRRRAGRPATSARTADG